MSLGDLSVPSVSIGGYTQAGLSPTDNKSWAKMQLARLLGKTAAQVAREKRDTQIYALDPDLACLRSVNLATKIRRQKRLNYEVNQAREEEQYRGILAGLWE